MVCIRTGWGRFYMTDNDRYVAGEPGIDLDAAQWLTSRDVVAIAADNMALEVLPGTRHPQVIMPVHQHCLAEAGVHIIENMALDELMADGITSFCFMLAPVKFKGATGCPGAPDRPRMTRAPRLAGDCVASGGELRELGAHFSRSWRRSIC